MMNHFKTILTNPQNSHFMLDVETNGLETTRNSITSFCMVQFVPGKEIMYSHKLHVRTTSLPGRIVDEPTMKWRKQNQVDEMEFDLPRYNSIKVLDVIRDFLKASGNPHIYALHKDFDITFINSYFEYRHAAKPWNYRNIFDIEDLILGMGYNRREITEFVLQTPKWKDTCKKFFNGNIQAHDAFYDCLLQIETLNTAIKARGVLK